MATQAQLAAVQQLYVGYLGRAADAEGQKFWADAIANGTATIASVATGFTLSAEYQAAYAGLDSAALVDKIYTNVLGRAADAEGKAFWVAALANGTVAADTLLATMITNLGALDQQTINNKVFVAQTYTDTVGADYNPEAGAEVISEVTNDPATVQDALDLINTGTLPGSVPALGLINALAAANAAVETYGKTVATEKPAFDVSGDGVVIASEATTTLNLAKADRAEAIKAVDGALNGNESTARLQANVTDATTASDTAKANVAAIPEGTAAINAYESAVAAYTALVGTPADQAAATAAQLAAEAGLNSALSTGSIKIDALETAASIGLATPVTFADAAAITTFLANPANEGLVGRAALVTELQKIATYGAAEVAAGDKALAVAKADALVSSTEGTLAAIDTIPASNGDTVGETYISASEALATAKLVVTAAQTADATVADAQAVVDQFTALTKAVTDAGTALTQFETANAAKIDLHNVSSNDLTTSSKADVFYFGSKIATGTESVTSFGAGDKIILGSNLTFNSGALTAGDNNKAEFFLVQKGNDTLVVLETQNYGSSTVAHTATSDTAAVTAPDANVITLTGVALADLTVNNGVISHVA